MKNNLRLIIVASITLVCMLYIFPWQSFGVEPFVNIKPYRLGLDLHGGVELDYKVDFADTAALSGNIVNKGTVIEGLKSIIDKRANGLGLSDPTIQTAQYGDESHIIVQIPTQDYGNISDEEKVKKNAQDIVKAKDKLKITRRLMESVRLYIYIYIYIGTHTHLILTCLRVWRTASVSGWAVTTA